MPIFCVIGNAYYKIVYNLAEVRKNRYSGLRKALT